MSSVMPTPLPHREVKYLDTIDAYDQWAEVYDTDGNFLQRLDSLELRTLLPIFLGHIGNSSSPKIVDLGCGTGRNTISLIRNGPADLTAIGLEPSNKMLEIARIKAREYLISAGEDRDRVSFGPYNLLTEPFPPSFACGADGVISTLVLEHVPVKAFFMAVAEILRPSGILLLTNMHSEMGGISQAGFVHPETGVKIRPKSYSHTVAETVEEAQACGFELLNEVKEVLVDNELAETLGPRALKWVGVQVWFGCCFRKK